MILTKDIDEESLESKAHILYSAAKWLIFYGTYGHGYEQTFEDGRYITIAHWKRITAFNFIGNFLSTQRRKSKDGPFPEAMASAQVNELTLGLS